MTTRLSDLIEPEVYNPYFAKLTTRLDAFYAAGIIGSPENFSFPDNGGRIVHTPYLNDLSGDAEELDDNGALTVNKRDAGEMRARVQYLGKAWGANELASAIAGVDPLDGIATLDAKWWAGQRQKRLLASLKGFFTTAAEANVLDISGTAGAAANIDAASTIDATQKLGDHKGMLGLIAMHSATEASLAKQDLIEYIEPSEGGDRVPVYRGKRVIVDDTMPVEADVFTSYIFGTSSVSYTPGTPVALTKTEVDRDSLAGDDIFIRRECFMLHPNGADWTDASVVGKTPTLAELETAANWQMWEDPKRVKIVAFKHKIG